MFTLNLGIAINYIYIERERDLGEFRFHLRIDRISYSPE